MTVPKLKSTVYLLPQMAWPTNKVERSKCKPFKANLVVIGRFGYILQRERQELSRNTKNNNKLDFEEAFSMLQPLAVASRRF